MIGPIAQKQKYTIITVAMQALVETGDSTAQLLLSV